MDSVGVRIQGLPPADQVLSLGRLAEARAQNGLFSPRGVEVLFDEIAVPGPARVTNVMGGLERKGLLMRVKVAGRQPNWRLTARGKEASQRLATDMDLAALTAEAAQRTVTYLADTAHPVIPPSLAPPELILPLRDFLLNHPFELNVFGMTRFPRSTAAAEPDPIAPALKVARKACERHGLEFHLASDRKIVDDLWPNVAAHLWGSQYSIAFFEDRSGAGLNYNLNIEVGSCLVLGRRMAVLKDRGVKKLPTDLVGRIYQEVDLDDPQTVSTQIHTWMRDDLKLGPCEDCPPTPD
jgi:hypothetical protein